MTELARHIGHRTQVLDDRRLRCIDCTQTVLLPASPSSTSTSSSPIPTHGEPRCDTHPFEHATGCRPCAADLKAIPEQHPAKPLAGWAAHAPRQHEDTPKEPS